MKNGKWSGILLYLWVTKLICHGFIDAGEKHKIPRSETQNFSLFTATEVIRLMAFYFFFFFFLVHTGRCKEGQLLPAYAVGFIRGEKNAMSEEPQSW